jgi:gamma-glutamylcysteine synthetase
LLATVTAKIFIFSLSGKITLLHPIGRYLRSVENEYQKLKDKSLLPSEKMYRQMKENNESFLEFGLRQAANNSQKFRQEEFEYDKRLRRA